jgi:SWI/SNF-related matrix-associated actin-dependent regulator of chromatin subfamily A3
MNRYSVLTSNRLNLATANRVFIVEPQWNPSVENQAIARALRLGQEQSVQVTRYVVNKTIEQVHLS